MIFKKRQYKLVVVDTSALMLFPEILKAKMCLFFIPITAVRQLDGLKNSPDPKKNGASRHASRLIEEGQQEGQVFILDQFVKIEGLDNASDNKIIGAAIQLAADNPGRKLVLLTTDKNMRFVANGHGIDVVDFQGFPELKTMRRLPLKYYAWMFASIIAMALFPVLMRTDFAMVSGFGGISFVIWSVAVWFYRNDRLSRDKMTDYFAYNIGYLEDDERR